MFMCFNTYYKVHAYVFGSLTGTMLRYTQRIRSPACVVMTYIAANKIIAATIYVLTHN